MVPPAWVELDEDVPKVVAQLDHGWVRGTKRAGAPRPNELQFEAGGGSGAALLSLGAQVTLTAVDTPDTRSWATLPARIAFAASEFGPARTWSTSPPPVTTNSRA